MKNLLTFTYDNNAKKIINSYQNLHKNKNCLNVIASLPGGSDNRFFNKNYWVTTWDFFPGHKRTETLHYHKTRFFFISFKGQRLLHRAIHNIKNVQIYGSHTSVCHVDAPRDYIPWGPSNSGVKLSSPDSHLYVSIHRLWECVSLQFTERSRHHGDDITLLKVLS